MSIITTDCEVQQHIITDEMIEADGIHYKAPEGVDVDVTVTARALRAMEEGVVKNEDGTVARALKAAREVVIDGVNHTITRNDDAYGWFQEYRVRAVA